MQQCNSDRSLGTQAVAAGMHNTLKSEIECSKYVNFPSRKSLQCRGSRAYVTTLRSPQYLVLVKELHCSIQKHSSPDVRLIVLAVPGDLNASIIADVQSFAEYREVEEFTFPHEWFPRKAPSTGCLPPHPCMPTTGAAGTKLWLLSLLAQFPGIFGHKRSCRHQP